MQDIDNNRSDSFNYKKSLKKSGNDPLNKFLKVEKYINRPLASLVVRIAYNTPISPNQLTFFSFFLGLSAAFTFSRGTPLYFLLGGILTQLSSIIDCADGMLARSRNQCSSFGSHLDLFLDRVTDFCIFISIAFGYYTYSGNLKLSVIGLLGAGLYLLQINLYYITNSYTQNHERGETGEARALLLLLILILSIMNRLDICIWLLIGETLAVNIFRIFYFIGLGYKKENKEQ